MDPVLRLRPGQQALTPAQEAEAKRFAEEYIQRHLSTEPVDEPEAEAFLRQAYAAAGLDPPQRIHWLDGPLQLVAVLAPPRVRASMRADVWFSVEASVRASVWTSVVDSMLTSVYNSVVDSVWESLWASVQDSVRARVLESKDPRVMGRVAASVAAGVEASVAAYHDAPWLACYQFFDGYLAPNALHALAHFNTLVSGYWLGQDTAVLVRRPKVLVRDGVGRLHCATGKCIAYADDWGMYAWHGVRVPERVILDPNGLTCEDFFKEPNVEVRRVIQERMGQRFVPELGGVVIDNGPHGTLYEVRLPEDDPERVARYVRVQDASTPRQYFLRVPPTVRTAAEAVAWTFSTTVDEYQPTEET